MKLFNVQVHIQYIPDKMVSHFHFYQPPIWPKIPILANSHFIANQSAHESVKNAKGIPFWKLKKLLISNEKFPFYRIPILSRTTLQGFETRNSHFIEFPFYREHPVHD